MAGETTKVQPENRELRYIVYRTGTRTYTIPEMWLVGRSFMREREGLNPRDAYIQAIQDWVELLTAEQRYRAQRRGR
jgi:hypothetical protein